MNASKKYTHETLVRYALDDRITEAEREEIDTAVDADESLAWEVEGIRTLSLRWKAYTLADFQAHMKKKEAKLEEKLAPYLPSSKPIAGGGGSNVRPLWQTPTFLISVASIAAVIAVLVLIFLPDQEEAKSLEGLLAEAETGMSFLRNGRSATSTRTLDAWEAEYQAGNYESAARTIDGILQSDFLSSAQVDSLRFFQGVSYYRARAYQQAKSSLQSVSSTSILASDARWLETLSLVQLHDLPEADPQRLQALLEDFAANEGNRHGTIRQGFARDFLKMLNEP